MKNNNITKIITILSIVGLRAGCEVDVTKEVARMVLFAAYTYHFTENGSSAEENARSATRKFFNRVYENVTAKMADTDLDMPDLIPITPRAESSVSVAELNDTVRTIAVEGHETSGLNRTDMSTLTRMIDKEELVRKDSATKIQAFVRGYLAKQTLQKAVEEKLRSNFIGKIKGKIDKFNYKIDEVLFMKHIEEQVNKMSVQEIKIKDNRFQAFMKEQTEDFQKAHKLMLIERIMNKMTSTYKVEDLGSLDLPNLQQLSNMKKGPIFDRTVRQMLAS